MCKLNIIKMTKEEEKELYSKWDDIEVRKQVFEANMPLAIYISNRYLSSIKIYESYFNLEDLQQVAYIGLWKAINNFDVSKNSTLGTFAGRCIENEIRMKLRELSLRKHNALALSFEHVVMESDENDKDLCIENIISFNNVEDNNEELINDIKRVLESLSKRERELFIDYHVNNIRQDDLVIKYNISQGYVSRLLKRAAKKVEAIMAM